MAELEQQQPDTATEQTGPSTDLSAKNMPQGTTKVEDGVAYNIAGKALGPVNDQPAATPQLAPAQVDYDALAKKYGAVGTAPTQAVPVDYDAIARKYGAVGTQATTPVTSRSAPQQSHYILDNTLSDARNERSNTALAQAKNVSNYIYNNILSKDAYHDSGLTYDQTPSSAWGKVKQRLWGWLTQDEINKIPGLEPERVAMLEQHGQDALANGFMTGAGWFSGFGKERADQIREHILNGSVVVNQPPEVFARAAAKTVTDFFSPGYYALGAFGKVAQGYQKAGQAAAATGDWVKAASSMGKARLLGLIGAGVNVPFAASQAHDLVDNWDKMSVPERVASLSGIMGATINTHVGINAAGGYKQNAQDALDLVKQGVSVPAQATKKAVGSLVTLGKAQDFNTAVERASNITAKNLADHRSKIQNVSSDLQAILNKNPQVSSPADFAKSINDHLEQQEQALLASAGATQHDVAPVVPDLEKRLSSHLDKFFADNRGKFGTQDEVDQAKEDIIGRVLQQTGKNPDGTPITRAPNLFEAENIRKGLNIDAAPQYTTNAKPTTNAYKAGAFEAAKVMRDAIDSSFDDRGIQNVKEFRQKEANLIDVRDRLEMAQKKAEDMGNGGLWDSLWKKFGAASTVSAIALGTHAPVSFGALAPYLVGERAYQNVKNPNRNVSRAAKLASPTAQATELEFKPPTTGTQPPPAPGAPPAAPTTSVPPPPAPAVPSSTPASSTHPSQTNPHPESAPAPLPPPHVLADNAAAVAPALMEEPPTNHALNAELATHFGESFDHAPLEDRIDHVKNDVEAMRRSGVAITPAQTKVLGKINEHEAEHTAIIEDAQKKSREKALEIAAELHKMLTQEAEEEKQHTLSKKAEELSQPRKVNKDTEPLHWQEENQRLKSIISNEKSTPEEKQLAQKRLEENQTLQAADVKPNENVKGLLDTLRNPQKSLEYTDEEIPVPEHYNYVTPQNTRIHEIGHLIASHAMGLPILDIISHLHPDADPHALAEARSDLSSLKDENGELDYDKVENKLPELLTRAVAGGMAEEVYGGVPFDKNQTIASDMQAARSLLAHYDVPKEIGEMMLKKARENAKNILTEPAISDIFKRYAEKRVENTHQNYHLSPATTAKMLGELGENSDRQAQTRRSNSISKKTFRLDEEPDAGAKGERAKETDGALQDKRESLNVQSPSARTKQQAGLVEKSTGDHDIDAIIRNGGGIPAGMVDMGEFGKIHMFHDPETGSTLGFKSSEKITPQNVGKKLAANREAFAKGEEANRQRQEDEAKLATRQAAKEKENKPEWWNEPTENKFAPKEMTKGDEVTDWIERHKVPKEGDKYVMYHATPVGSGATDSIRAGSLLAEDPETAIHQASRERGAKAGQIKVGKVLVKPEDIKPGVWASVRNDHPVSEWSKPKPAQKFNLLKTAQKDSLSENDLHDAADAYNKAHGLPPIDTSAVGEDPRSSAVADAYKSAVHAPSDPAVKTSYDALKRDVKEQYHLAQQLGIKMDVKTENPYGLSTDKPAHEELHDDVRNNKHLSVWSGGTPPADHPLSEIDPETGHTYNELFRMVHDIFGHSAERTDFSPAGEEHAWNLHRQMFSPAARPALATETKGQAAYTYKYGDFPPQKAAILPEEFHQPNAAIDLSTKQKATPEWQKRVAETPWETDDKPWNSFATGYRQLIIKDPKGNEIGALKYSGDEGDLYSRIRTSRLDPDYQNQGIAKEMYKSAIEDARNRGIKEFRSDTTVSNSARNVWQALAREGYPVHFAYTNNFNANGAGGIEYTIPLQGQKITDADFEPLNKDWATNVHSNLEKEPAGGINPNAPDAESKRYGFEIMPEVRQAHEKLSPEAFRQYAERPEVKAALLAHPDIKLGWDITGKKPELNIGATTDNLAKATEMANKLDQRALWDNEKKEVIPVAGKGEKTQFPDYPMSQRLIDLSTKQKSPKGSSVPLMKNPLEVEGTGNRGEVNTLDLTKALNEFSRSKNPALEPGSEPKEMVDRAKKLAEDEAKYQLAQSKTGTEWYTTEMKDHDKVLQALRPELAEGEKTDSLPDHPVNLTLFKAAEAILSSGQKPYRNVKSALNAWDLYKETGEFPPTNPATGKSWGPRGAAGYGNAFDSINKLIAAKGEKGAADWLLNEHPVSELKEYNSNVSGKMTDMEAGAKILGEKRGPFMQNLHGIESKFTADMWVSRTWNRWMGTLDTNPDIEDKGKLDADSDKPRNNTERALMKESFEKTANKLNLTTSSLQAVLWYYEQALYRAHGIPVESWSFSDAAKRVAKEANVPESEQTGFNFGANQGQTEGGLEALAGTAPKKAGQIHAFDFLNALKNNKK